MVKILFAIFFSFIFNSYSDELSLTRYKGNFCYDGDTCYGILENVPEKLKFVRIRIRGIDTPEIKGKCDNEKALAIEAKNFINKLISESHSIKLRNLEWGKYGGRIVADLYIDNTDYLVYLKGKSFYTLYSGGKKTKNWCN